MGAWGYGIFESDAAMDFVVGIRREWEALIHNGISRRVLSNAENEVMPLVAMMTEIDAMSPPEPHVVAKWRRDYLALFDEEVHRAGWRDGPTARRCKVVEAFDALAAKSARFWGSAPVAKTKTRRVKVSRAIPQLPASGKRSDK